MAKGRASWWAMTGVALLCAACHEPRQTGLVSASAAVEPAVLDFGEVPVGEWASQEVTIKNVGFVPFHALQVLRLDDDPSFAAELADDSKVMPGEDRVVTVRFHPLREGELGDRLQVSTDAEHRPTDPVMLKGTGSPSQVQIIPSTVDFQTLEIDSERWLGAMVVNPTDLPLTIRVTGPGESQFETAQAEIPPSGTFKLDARFLPRVLGHSGAKVELRACQTCTPATAALQGESVQSAFAFEPQPLAFEPIPVHEVTQSNGAARNVTWRPVTITGVSTSDVSFTPLNSLSQQEVAPGAAVPLQLQFAARSSGPDLGEMTVEYTSDKPRLARLVLDATGGRPTLAVAPVALELGDLPVGAKTEKVIRLSNAGATGDLLVQGVGGRGPAVGQFNVSPPFRGTTSYPYSGGGWPAWTAADVPIAPGNDFLDVKVYFEPLQPGDFTAEVLITTSDQFNPVRSVTVHGTAHRVGTCRYLLSPLPRIDFGVVQPRFGAVLGFRFDNVGTEECAVKDIHVSDDGGGAFFMPGGPLTGGSVPVQSAFSAQVAFKPQNAGRYTGELAITVNDPAQTVVKLPLAGNAYRPCLTAAPRFLDFGAIRYDCAPVPRAVYVANQCSVPVAVSNGWIGTGTSGQFRVVKGPRYAVTLEPGAGFEVEVTYDRTVLGQHFSPLYFQAVGEPSPFLVPLLAETNHEGFSTERFVQGTDSQLDVLFVVSNTTTMDPFQRRLQAALPGFIAKARDAGVDVRAGVTTTGLVPRSAVCPGGAMGGEAGRLFPVDHSLPRIASSADAAAAAALQQQVGVGLCHNLVQGLESMRAALSTPLVDGADDPRTPAPQDGNLGLTRDTARMAVIFLSDEDDHSGFDPESYVQFLRAFKGPDMAQRTQAHAVVPVSGGCTTAGPPGPRFAQVAKETGGTVTDVCGGDYSALLEGLAVKAAGPQREFRLSDPATGPAEMTVTVDGVRSAAWTFDAASNSVVFDGSAVPRSGQVVAVSYRSVCGTPPPLPLP
ncbi:MAG TPA: choice-of-anchor D domain-containing protein [Myxococcaceae bacterium]|nr:choice-of-anchor D domain-containing protein [Myxococcaceae bacterium]